MCVNGEAKHMGINRVYVIAKYMFFCLVLLVILFDFHEVGFRDICKIKYTVLEMPKKIERHCRKKTKAMFVYIVLSTFLENIEQVQSTVGIFANSSYDHQLIIQHYQYDTTFKISL